MIKDQIVQRDPFTGDFLSRKIFAAGSYIKNYSTHFQSMLAASLNIGCLINQGSLFQLAFLHPHTPAII